MTDQPDFLAELASAVRLAHQRLDALDKMGLETLLGTGGFIRSALVPGATGQGLQGGFLGDYAGGVSGGQAGAGSANTLGNVQPLIGQQNLIADSGLFDFRPVAVIGTAENTDGSWFTKYVLNSGSAPATRSAALAARAWETALNPFASADAVLSVAAGASPTDVDIYTRPAPFAPVDLPTLPFLVAAVRLFARTVSAKGPATVRLDIVSGASSPTTLEASSHELAWDAMPEGQQIQLVAAIAHTPAEFYATKWWWRLRLHYFSPNPVLAAVDFGEPQLHFAYSPDPVPFIRPHRPFVAPGSTQTLAAGTTIIAPFDTPFLPIGSAGNITLTATPTIPDGVDGQAITLLNVGANNISVQDEGTLAGSNLRLTGTALALTPRDSIQFMYSAAVGDWVQVGVLVAVL